MRAPPSMTPIYDQLADELLIVRDGPGEPAPEPASEEQPPAHPAGSGEQA